MIELSQYAYFDNKTLESILRKIYLSNIVHDVTTSKKKRFHHLCLGNVCLDIFLKTFFMYALLIPVQTKVHFKNLQFPAVTYDMGFLSFAFDVV